MERPVRPPKTSRQARAKARVLMEDRNQKEIAKRALIDDSKLSRWLRGAAGLSYDEIWRFACVFGVTVESLCDDDVIDVKVVSPPRIFTRLKVDGRQGSGKRL